LQKGGELNDDVDRSLEWWFIHMSLQGVRAASHVPSPPSDLHLALMPFEGAAQGVLLCPVFVEYDLGDTKATLV
jgi:hypothetical protein